MRLAASNVATAAGSRRRQSGLIVRRQQPRECFLTQVTTFRSNIGHQTDEYINLLDYSVLSLI